MVSYLAHLRQVGDTNATFAHKRAYIHHNYGHLFHMYQKPSILDVGPGMGILISYAREHGAKTIDVLDNDSSVLQYISSTYQVRNMIKSRSNNLARVVTNSYDLIFLMQIVEHIPKSAYRSFLLPLYQSLKPGGKLVILVPNGGNPLNMIERYSDLQHENLFTEFTLTDLPASCGMKNYQISIEPYRIPPITMVNVIRRIIQKLIHLGMRALVVGNGGVYQNIMTPNITLIITKVKK